MGRRSTFTDEIAETICERLARGESLIAICRDEAMPGERTVYDWLSEHADFRRKCARAREVQAEVMDHRILDVAERVECGALAPDAARVALSAYQWRAAKLSPKVYGDKLELEHSGSVGFFVEGPAVAASPEAWVSQYNSANAFGDQVPALNPPS